MNQPTHPLETIQRWMQSVLMHPDGVEAGVSTAESQRHIECRLAEIGRIVLPSTALSAVERLSIYANAYYARLLECLREEYPVLATTLGEDVFDEMAFAYLQAYPSRSYTLNDLGREFPRFLDESCPREEGNDIAGWGDFLSDLATLESAYGEVFDGPGVEGIPLLGAENLLGMDPDQLLEARLVFVPCFRLLKLRFPVHEYYSAIRREEDTRPPSAALTYLAMTRRDYVVRRCPVAPSEYQTLQAFSQGLTIGEGISVAAGCSGQALEHLALELRGWFARWAFEGFIQSLDLGTGQPVLPTEML